MVIFYVSSWLYPTATVGYTAKFYWFKNRYEKLEAAQRFPVKDWTGVASWKWVANDDNCGICRMPFDGCCPDCKYPGDDCPLVWGQCSHCFHMHCIVKWLHSQQVNQHCPMCRQEWHFNN